MSQMSWNVLCELGTSYLVPLPWGQERRCVEVGSGAAAVFDLDVGVADDKVLVCDVWLGIVPGLFSDCG
jgi:hypothetical protein